MSKPRRLASTSDSRMSEPKEETVKYLVLIYHNPQSQQLWEAFSDAQRAEGLQVYAALNKDLVDSGELIAAEALADSSLARRVSAAEGRTMATDGPLAEVKEQLAGFYLVECESLDRAIVIAARVPEARFGLVEVRPIMTYSGLDV